MLHNARKFYKGRKMVLIALENGIFSLPKQYLSGLDEFKEDDLDSSEFLPEEK